VIDCRRFLSRDAQPQSLTSDHSGVGRRDVTAADSDSSDAARQRRELVYNAVQRRLQSS